MSLPRTLYPPMAIVCPWSAVMTISVSSSDVISFATWIASSNATRSWRASLAWPAWCAWSGYKCTVFILIIMHFIECFVLVFSCFVSMRIKKRFFYYFSNICFSIIFCIFKILFGKLKWKLFRKLKSFIFLYLKSRELYFFNSLKCLYCCLNLLMTDLNCLILTEVYESI